METALTFVLVGHCDADSHALLQLVRQLAPAAAIVSVDDEVALGECLKQPCVLLVNRVLDGDFEAESGIELIARLAQDPGGAPPMVLISNFAEAQDAAVAAGAQRGFGKSQLNSPATKSLLQALAVPTT